MNRFTITSVSWNAEKNKIVLVVLHQFIERNLNFTLYVPGPNFGPNKVQAYL